ncbi:MAG: hypothetical protein HKN87_20345 [Saprospiraceae bacterium]|nr:hypothetical protein [Saprospiraceae bacterium]
MEVATVHQIKKELETLDHKNLLAICLRLAKFKKENKELLTYMLFEADDQEAFCQQVKAELTSQVTAANRANVYWTKKSIRKTIKYLDKIVRISASKETEIELRTHFVRAMKEQHIPMHRSRVMANMFDRQVKKIESALEKIHEDLQYDYREELHEILA